MKDSLDHNARGDTYQSMKMNRGPIWHAKTIVDPWRGNAGRCRLERPQRFYLAKTRQSRCQSLRVDFHAPFAMSNQLGGCR